MRSRYIVAYDVTDQKRLRRVHRVMRGFGDAMQYSVFRCDLSPGERVILTERLTDAIDLKEDSVLIVDIGPVVGRGEGSIRTIGRRRDVEDRLAVIV